MELKTFTPKQNTQLHLYVASACPFCHRVVAALALTGLAKHVSLTWMNNIKAVEGWAIEPEQEPAFAESRLAAVYTSLDPETEWRPSVPLLIDLADKAILSTSSADLIRYVAKGMNGAYAPATDLYPQALSADIDQLNDWLHQHINRAVYLVGFANEQQDYEAKVKDLFQALDDMETRLAQQPYLMGDVLTASDLYLFATLVRFDEIYFPLFKCSYRLIRDYPALSAYLERLLALPELKQTVDVASFKQHYYCSVMHVGDNPLSLNPMGTIPVSMADN